MVLAAFIGRLPLSMVGLGCVLLIASETGSYGYGGAVAAVGAITTALAGPVIGRLADVHGQRRVLLPVLVVFVIAGVGFLSAVKGDWPKIAVFFFAGVGGACIPPVSSMIRVRWTHLLRGSHRLPTALAMESVVDEFVFIVGPVLVTFLSTTGHATSGVVTAFTLAVVGSLAFAAQRRTEPPPHGHESRKGPSAMRYGGLRVLFVVGAAVGAVLGTLEIALVAFADEAGAKALSGVLIAGLALGSMASGIGWGTVHWRLPLRHRLVGVLALLTVLTLPAADRAGRLGDVPVRRARRHRRLAVADQRVHPRRAARAAGRGHRGLHLDRHRARAGRRPRRRGVRQARRRLRRQHRLLASPWWPPRPRPSPWAPSGARCGCRPSTSAARCSPADPAVACA